MLKTSRLKQDTPAPSKHAVVRHECPRFAARAGAKFDEENASNESQGGRCRRAAAIAAVVADTGLFRGSAWANRFRWESL